MYIYGRNDKRKEELRKQHKLWKYTKLMRDKKEDFKKGVEKEMEMENFVTTEDYYNSKTFMRSLFTFIESVDYFNEGIVRYIEEYYMYDENVLIYKKVVIHNILKIEEEVYKKIDDNEI